MMIFLMMTTTTTYANARYFDNRTNRVSREHVRPRHRCRYREKTYNYNW